ncbi:MAG: hypothetical protein U9Q68_07165 [Euryarchaeota archaeon]|nr:hypothetical protein [Euryarchaeota archaeon]
MKYSVIVCPKCKSHVQIIEDGIKSTVCQRCGGRLDIKKLKIWHTTADLADAVSVRTALLMKLDE